MKASQLYELLGALTLDEDGEEGPNYHATIVVQSGDWYYNVEGIEGRDDERDVWTITLGAAFDSTDHDVGFLTAADGEPNYVAKIARAIRQTFEPPHGLKADHRDAVYAGLRACDIDPDHLPASTIERVADHLLQLDELGGWNDVDALVKTQAEHINDIAAAWRAGSERSAA